MLQNVAERSSRKTYCKIRGTSCHQCRQKTLDMKTICRSGECIGVRGQFCGPCLQGRYGENAVEALKDPNWACPPCRGLCNCSICRNRNGLRPTGCIAPMVRYVGYSSVKDYLQAAELQDT
ncbi:Cell division cycle-associated 7-like protein [Harpegnathos saltator]|uniref:Cell division cycle-associated 7-like protein n=2 Tax=Harpegnathos saltator TaxID=610380 RepID=E2BJX0_HARSA|nr:Cell division cycle-associated 7-like protein [Harpegnathos saltator]